MTTDTESKIVNQLERTNKLIERLENTRYLQMIDRPFRFLWLSFLHGVAVALGSTLGFAIIVTLVAYILQKLQIFTPLSDTLKTLQNATQQLRSGR